MVGDESDAVAGCPDCDLEGEVSGARESFGVGSNASGGLFALFCLANSALSSPTEGVVSGTEAAVDSMAFWVAAQSQKGIHAGKRVRWAWLSV